MDSERLAICKGCTQEHQVPLIKDGSIKMCEHAFACIRVSSLRYAEGVADGVQLTEQRVKQEAASSKGD
jgi:hypothetical protein